ncbi:hypothetical protein JCM11251_005605 [Rhodosporidiobolus azoricus]
MPVLALSLPGRPFLLALLVAFLLSLLPLLTSAQSISQTLAPVHIRIVGRNPPFALDAVKYPYDETQTVLGLMRRVKNGNRENCTDLSPRWIDGTGATVFFVIMSCIGIALVWTIVCWPQKRNAQEERARGLGAGQAA